MYRFGCVKNGDQLSGNVTRVVGDTKLEQIVTDTRIENMIAKSYRRRDLNGDITFMTKVTSGTTFT